MHHESNVTTDFEYTRFEGSVVKIKIMSRKSQLNLKGPSISTVSRQHHDIPWRLKTGREGPDSQTNVTTFSIQFQRKNHQYNIVTTS